MHSAKFFDVAFAITVLAALFGENSFRETLYAHAWLFRPRSIDGLMKSSPTIERTRGKQLIVKQRLISI